MDHLGIDVHKRESQICILTEGGEIIERRIRTEAERFAAVLGCACGSSGGQRLSMADYVAVPGAGKR